MPPNISFDSLRYREGLSYADSLSDSQLADIALIYPDKTQEVDKLTEAVRNGTLDEKEREAVVSIVEKAGARGLAAVATRA